MATTETLVAAVYDALQERAARILDNRRASVSPASLVHDVVLKLYRSQTQTWQDETHFRAVAAVAMRQILADRARRKATAKHGANADHITLSGVGSTDDPLDLIALHTALVALEEARPLAARVAVCKLFGGLVIPEIARELDCSESTVKREWRVGHAWLRRHLAD